MKTINAAHAAGIAGLAAPLCAPKYDSCLLTQYSVTLVNVNYFSVDSITSHHC